MPLLHSNIIGEGTPLIILHGFLGMSDNWKTLGNKYASAGFQVHLIDQRNHGKSFWSDIFTYEEMVNDLRAYLEHYQLSKVCFLGHSMGGKTAMKFACTYPELTDKLIVADIAPKYYPPHHKNILHALTTLALDKISSRKEADEALSKELTDMGIRQFLLKNLYWVEKEQLGFRFNLNVLRTKMEEIGDTISATDIFNGPTLFLKGDRSAYITPEDIPEIKRHFPLAEIKSIANAGHWLHAENPQQFYEESLKFLIS